MGLEKSDASHIHIVIILFSVNLNHAMSIDVYSIRLISFVIEANIKFVIYSYTMQTETHRFYVPEMTFFYQLYEVGKFFSKRFLEDHNMNTQ